MHTINFMELDVRPILRAGGEPFEKIMEAVTALAPGQGLRLWATFKPIPLFHVLGSRGYSHAEKELGNGDWEVEFSPGASSPQVAPEPASTVTGAPTTDSALWPEPLQEMDARDWEPPEPMINILAVLELMNEGEVLAALLNREPLFLLPELSKRGHEWHGAFEADNTAYRLVVRVGAASGASA
ncbi:universal stress protein [Pandoraea thiooxydans]|uniref:Universal stress protein n=1 Tax=Pandoraea thiooxydans TaxID=445709 RepID=A0A0G3EP80_9BURK|nr:DUF2249 domain-containing protein [Pandoraea thiooxydans]AKJ67122.1 universal stress protein [Pandoraea thiooxydans]APR94079.1 universal stress protein [Pandoraea thiooxydans]